MTRDAEHTPSPQSVLWMMHVVGPDDIYPAPDHATAVQWCAYLNREIAPKVPSVLCVAVPAIWTGTAEEHAEGLAEAIRGWTAPAAPAPSSLAGGEVMRLVPDRVLTEALYWMARGYERVHSMPRVSDTELANKIEAAKADLSRARDASPILAALSPEAPAREGRAVVKGGQWDAHTGEDYADVMLPSEHTENASIRVYSDDEALPQRIADALNALTPRHEAPSSPAWRDEYNRVEAIREAAEGQDRIARSTADPIAKSDAETQAAGHWTRYEREVAKLNAASGHEAPAEDDAVSVPRRILNDVIRNQPGWLDSVRRYAEAPAEGAGEDGHTRAARQRLDLIAHGAAARTVYHPSTWSDEVAAFWADVSALRARSSAPEAREHPCYGEHQPGCDCVIPAYTEQEVPSFLKRMTESREEVQPVGRAGEMPGSNGGFSMAVFKSTDVPIDTPLYTHPAAPSADKLREVRQDVINHMADNIEKLALTPAKRELVKAAFRACIGRLSTPDALNGEEK